jgi:RND family efflux transporter MFP subunit
MQHLRFSSTFLLSLTFFFYSCNNNKEGNHSLASKKEQLSKLIAQKNKLDEDIKALQSAINQLDSGTSNNSKSKLVGVSDVAIQKFQHFIDLRGKLDAENISYISPRGMGGQVKAIFIKEGDFVKKGQLLLKLDEAILRQAYTAARQQLEGIKTQLTYAKNIYDRQNNLWQKGIGTEVQLISAKTNVEALQNQLKSAEEQSKVAAEQLNTASVYSDVDGVAEIVMVKVGELFSGMGQIKIVNTSKLKVVANVPENYLTNVKKGTPVVVDIKDANKTINTSISLIGQTIENSQRGFVAEAKIPTDHVLKPNQSVIMRILDYATDKAVVIPVNTIQSDENNKYVYVMENKNNKMVATRKIVVLGSIYGDLVEVKSGLTGGEKLITAGYQNLYEGQTVTTQQ